MGIYHFAGLGTSPGAVTAGLSYIRAKYGARHPQYGDMIEAVILFTSPAVAQGEMKSFATEHNEYGKPSGRKKWTQGRQNAVEIVREFLNREMPSTTVYLATVDVNDFSNCLAVVGQTALRFHTPNHTGKHIWANITGSTNLVNMAISQIAYLTGVVGRLYYTFIANVKEQGKFLQPFTTDPTQFRYDEIYTFKTRFSSRQQAILEELEKIEEQTPGSCLTGGELLSRLKARAASPFESTTLPTFKTDFLNVMAGRSIEQLGDRINGQQDQLRLSDEGKQQLALLRQPLFRALIGREPLDDRGMEDALTGSNLQTLLAPSRSNR